MSIDKKVETDNWELPSALSWELPLWEDKLTIWKELPLWTELPSWEELPISKTVANDK